MADGAGGNRTGKGVRGRPFPPGQQPPGAAPAWRKGDPSPNPSGRPKTEPGFRAKCRVAAEEMLEKLRNVTGDYSTGDGGGGTDIAGMVRAFEAMADRGGYVTTDKLAMSDLQRTRLLLAMLGVQSLTPEAKQQIIAVLQGQAAQEQPLLEDGNDSDM